MNVILNEKYMLGVDTLNHFMDRPCDHMITSPLQTCSLALLCVSIHDISTETARNIHKQ